MATLTVEQLDHAADLVLKKEMDSVLDYLIDQTYKRSGLDLDEEGYKVFSEGFVAGYSSCADVYWHLLKRRKNN